MQASEDTAKDQAEHEDEALRILAIAPEQDTATRIERHLRSAGHNLRVDWLAEPESLGEYIDESPPALICCREADHKRMARLLALCVTAAHGAPVVAIDETIPDNVPGLMQQGAADVVGLDEPERLVAVLQRELVNARRGRALSRAHARERELEQRVDSLLKESNDARAVLDEGIHAELNPAYATLFGFDDPAELEGVPLMDLVAPADRDTVKQTLAACRTGKYDGGEIHFQAQGADDELFPVSLHCNRLGTPGENRIEIVIPQAAASGNGSSTMDHRRRLYRDLEAQPGDERSILYLVIDGAGKMARNLGLPTADRLLDEAAALVLERLHANDRAYRFDEEGIAIVTARELSEAEKLAETLRAAIESEGFGIGGETSLTATIAAAPLQNGDRPLAALMNTRESARTASQRGGNHVVNYQQMESDQEDRESDRRWLERIKQALAENRFTLAFQSIASLEGATEEYHDLLVRMLDDDGSQIPPRTFLPTAERHGLSPRIDQWVLSQALDLATQQDKPYKFFVKVSEASLENGKALLDWLGKRLSESGADASRLLFTFPETLLARHTRKARELAEGLDEFGFGVAVSGFGAAPNAVRLLEEVPADFVKLDSQLTQAIAQEGDSAKLNDAMRAAHEQGVKIIAEHVEDANSMARLWQLGVHYIQGNYVQEPGSVMRSHDPSIA